MNQPRFSFERLKKQDRSHFCCGVEPLDNYLKTGASQDVKRKAAVCYLAIETATGTIAGFYTLSASHVPITDIDPEQIRHFPRYPDVPTVRIGRLAIDKQFQGLGLGGALIADAANHAINSGFGRPVLMQSMAA